MGRDEATLAPGGAPCHALTIEPAPHRPTRACWLPPGCCSSVPIVALHVGVQLRPRRAAPGRVAFFFWYQMLWVFLASACTYAAYKLVQRAAPHRPMVESDDERGRTDERPGHRLRRRMNGVNGVALAVFIFFFLAVTVMGFLAARWRRRRDAGQPRRMGPGRPVVRHLGHLVPARRRPLHGVHLRRRPGGDLRDGRGPASSPCRTRSWSTR